MKRVSAKVQKDELQAVAMEPTSPQPVHTTRAGIRPLLSANQPNKSPPIMEPQKKMDWADEIK